MATYRLLPRRVVPAMAAGAATGAGVVAVFLGFPMFLQSPGSALFWVPLTFIVALVLWIIGLAVFGSPLWWFSERAGRRSPAWALSAGLIAGFLAWTLLMLMLESSTLASSVDGRVLIQSGQRTLHGWLSLLRGSVLMGLLGGVVATVIWRIAYRRIEAA